MESGAAPEMRAMAPERVAAWVGAISPDITYNQVFC